MSRALLASSAPVQRFSVLECTPCAVMRAMPGRRRAPLGAGTMTAERILWSPELATFAVEAAAGAVLLAGANEVLVPSSLVEFVEAWGPPGNGHGSSHAAPLPLDACVTTWKELAKDHRLVVLVGHRDVPAMLQRYPAYHNLCVPVPSGPLSAKMFFNQSGAGFYQDDISVMLDAIADAAGSAGGPSTVQWRAWMRSGLTCRYEGAHVNAIRVSEHAAELLGHHGGCCQQVILEQGTDGLTPRWLETVAKTALSCGVPTAALSLALCSSSNATRLMGKAVDVGITQFATSTLRDCGSPFVGAEALVDTPTAAAFAIGWTETSAASQVTAAEEELLSSGAEFADSLAEEWAALGVDAPAQDAPPEATHAPPSNYPITAACL